MKTNVCLLFLLILSAFTVTAQNVQVYELYLINDSLTNAGFVSLSDNYKLSEHRDSLAVPDVSALTEREAERLVLRKEYRTRFLNALKISEKDRIFIYNYAHNIMVTIPVNQANVVAWINPYGIGGSKITQYDYMIGFEFTQKQLKGIKDKEYPYGFVCVGKENPFAEGQVKPMAWKKTAPSAMPKIAMTPEIKEIVNEYGPEKYTLGDVHTFEADGLAYYLQDYNTDDEGTTARRLLVLDNKTRKLVAERFFYNSEGSSVAPLDNEGSIAQFAGKLFKNTPTVAFGFEYASFGCEGITVIGSLENDIYINCDNRH